MDIGELTSDVPLNSHLIGPDYDSSMPAIQMKKQWNGTHEVNIDCDEFKIH